MIGAGARTGSHRAGNNRTFPSEDPPRNRSTGSFESGHRYTAPPLPICIHGKQPKRHPPADRANDPGGSCTGRDPAAQKAPAGPPCPAVRHPLFPTGTLLPGRNSGRHDKCRPVPRSKGKPRLPTSVRGPPAPCTQKTGRHNPGPETTPYTTDDAP